MINRNIMLIMGIFWSLLGIIYFIKNPETNQNLKLYYFILGQIWLCGAVIVGQLNSKNK